MPQLMEPLAVDSLIKFNRLSPTCEEEKKGEEVPVTSRLART
jgi:hypothetical protein